MLAERLEDRALMAADANPWFNQYFPADVDGDMALSPRDALVVINELNRGGARALLASSFDAPADSGNATTFGAGSSDLPASDQRVDVNGDGFVAPGDALLVINGLNGEGEPNAVTFRIAALNPVDGAEVTSVQVGSHIRLRTTVEDTRTASTRNGVFAAYMDLGYSTQFRLVTRETQRLTITGNSDVFPLTGSITLTFNGQTTAPITIDKANSQPTATAIKNALEALNNIDLGEIEVIANNGAFDSYDIKFGGQRYGDTNVPNMTVTGNFIGGESPSATMTELPGSVPGDVGEADSVVNSTGFSASYPNGRSALDGTTSDPNVLDEIGAFGGTAFLGAGQKILFTEEFVAISVGSGSFAASPADVLPAHNVLVYGSNVAVPTTDIVYPTLNLTVSQPANAVDDTGTATEDQTTTSRINVLSNDVTNNGQKFLQSFTATSVNGGTVTRFTNGTSATSDDQLDYRPAANFFGTDTFTYVLGNSATGGNTSTGTVTITVAGVNDAPTVAGPTSVTTTEDTSFAFTGGNTVSVADIDAGTGNVSVTVTGTSAVQVNNTFSALITSGANNSATMTLTGTVTQVNSALATLQYNPAQDANGSHQVTVTVNDNGNTGSGGAKSASRTIGVTVTAVNDAPVNNLPAAQTTNEGVPLVFTAANGNAITITDVDAAAASINVQLSLVGITGTLTLGSITGLSPVTGNGTASISMTGSLANINNALNNLTYSPPNLLVATGSIRIVTNDQGNTGSGGAKTDTDDLTVNVIPNVRPKAINDSATVNEDSTNNSVSVLGNDIPNVVSGVTQAIKLATVSDPPSGTASIDDNGTPSNLGDDFIRYTPDPNFFGTDVFTYVIQDQAASPGPDSTGTVTITVTGVNDTPVLTDNTVATNEDTALTIASSTLLGNDNPGPGEAGTQTLSITAVSGTTTKGGTVTISGSNIIYTPKANYNDVIDGADTFTYTATDNGTNPANLSATATVTINIAAVNDNPIATNDSVTDGIEDTPITVAFSTLLGNDAPGPATATDEASQTLSVTSVTNAGGGTLQVNSTNFVYTPADDFNGDVTLQYSVSDGAGGSAPATITINFREVNDAPTANNDTATAVKNASKTYSAASLLGNDSKGPTNEDGQQLSISSVSPTSAMGGTVVLNGDGTVTYTPPTDYVGADSFTYKAIDNGTTLGSPAPLESNSATVNITALNFVPMTFSGSVYFDLNENGSRDENEPGIADVEVTLSGVDAINGPIEPITVLTDKNGHYEFTELAPGDYHITEQQPTNTTDGAESVSGPVVVFGNDDLRLNISVEDNVDLPTHNLTGNNFGERGVNSAFAGINNALIASAYDPTSALAQGIIFSYTDSSAEDVAWFQYLNGWDGYLDANLDLAADRQSAVLTVVNASNETMTTTVTVASSRLRIRTDAAGNVAVHVVGRPEDFTFVQAGSQGEQGEGEGPEVSDAIMIATRCRTDRSTAEVIQAVDAALASGDFWA